MEKIVLIKLLMFLQLTAHVTSLKDLRLIMPDAVAVDDAVTLNCDFDLEGDALYSVRWYFETEEFYRYVPKESPPTITFAISGTNVDVTKSGERKVTLRSVNLNQSGSYQCEVSADAPSFHTESKTATLQVVELPSSEPVLTIFGMPTLDNKRIVMIDETFKATCVSGPSYPAVNFTWLLNGTPFPSTNTGLREIGTGESWESREAWSEIVIYVDNHMVAKSNHRLLVRCETNIFSLYKGKCEAEMRVIDKEAWLYGEKMSPNIDQRSEGSNGDRSRGDPDNSALTGGTNGMLATAISVCMIIILNLFNRLS